MPSGSPRVDVGSDHHRPLNDFCAFFSARTAYSITCTRAFTPTSFHIATIASDMGLSLAV